MSPYDAAKLPVWMQGNVFLGGAKPCKHEKAPLVRPDFDPAVKLVKEADGWYLELSLDKDWGTAQTRKLMTTALLGKAAVPNLPYERPDGSPLRLDTDYFGKARSEANPFPGPFELPEGGKQRLKVWPLASTPSTWFSSATATAVSLPARPTSCGAKLPEATEAANTASASDACSGEPRRANHGRHERACRLPL